MLHKHAICHGQFDWSLEWGPRAFGGVSKIFLASRNWLQDACASLNFPHPGPLQLMRASVPLRNIFTLQSSWVLLRLLSYYQFFSASEEIIIDFIQRMFSAELSRGRTNIPFKRLVSVF